MTTSTTPRSTIRIATRASRLALWQADHVAWLIKVASPNAKVEIIHVSTSGDRNQTEALRSFGGMGVFTREVQKAVLDDQADIAVHSLKDLPTESAAGLYLGAVPPREETADALILPKGQEPIAEIEQLPHGARIGTGSVRRQAQLRYLRPDFQIGELRGNVETRLRKLDEREHDAIVLAFAGMKRLGLSERISLVLNPPQMFAAVGQGALGIECRESDGWVREILNVIDDSATRCRVVAERALLAHLRAGCHAPVGVATCLDGDEVILEAVVLSPDGTQRLIATDRGLCAAAAELGVRVGDELLRNGADRLIGASV